MERVALHELRHQGSRLHARVMLLEHRRFRAPSALLGPVGCQRAAARGAGRDAGPTRPGAAAARKGLTARRGNALKNKIAPKEASTFCLFDKQFFV